MLINYSCVNFWLFVSLFLFNVFVMLLILLWCTFLLGEVAVDLQWYWTYLIPRFTHAGLTTRYRTKSLYKSILCSQGYTIYSL